MRNTPIKQLVLLLITVVCFSACQIKTVRVRDQGKLIEKYQINRKTKEKEGYAKSFYDNKKIAIVEYYKNGLLDGTITSYYPDGSTQSTTIATAGKYEGDFRYYYEDGTLKQKGIHRNDKIEGNLTSYYPNGQIKEVVWIRANDENGPFREYNQAGVLTAQGNYVTVGEATALEDGLLYLYDKETGKLEKKMRCKEGVCCTIWNNTAGYVSSKNKLCDEILDKE